MSILSLSRKAIAPLANLPTNPKPQAAISVPDSRDTFSSDSSWMRPWGVKVAKEDGEMVIVAEIPGFEPDDLDVRIQGDTLTILADRKQATRERFSYGHFEESLQIPPRTDPSLVRAVYHDGVLELRLPLADGAEAKPFSIQLESSWYGPDRSCGR